MSNDYEQQVRDLAAQLPPLQANFTKLQTDYHKEQLKAQVDLSTKTASAMQSLQALVVLLYGDFNPSSPPAELPAAVTNLSTTWHAADKASEHYLVVVNSFSAVVSLPCPAKSGSIYVEIICSNNSSILSNTMMGT